MGSNPTPSATPDRLAALEADREVGLVRSRCLIGVVMSVVRFEPTLTTRACSQPIEKAALLPSARGSRFVARPSLPIVGETRETEEIVTRVEKELSL